jgi:hypothetical protein
MTSRKLGNYFILQGSILIPLFLILMFTGKLDENIFNLLVILLTSILFFLGFSVRSIFSEDKVRKKNTYWLIGISLSLFSIGFFFKTMHWQGAGVIIILATFMFSLSALPLLVKLRYEKWKSFTSNSIHTLLVCLADLLSLMSVSLGILFKLQHWYGSYLLFSFGVVLFILAFFAWNIIFKKSLRKSRESEIKLNDTLQELKSKHEIIEEKNKEITDSINYAKRLQDAILPPKKMIDEFLKDNFILFKPKDIVAGDFYWAEKVGNYFFIAAADCTGHGVPGAMVSVVCSSALNRTVKEFGIVDPGKILDKTTDLVLETFEKSDEDVKDGMDISLLAVAFSARAENESGRIIESITWSGANNPLWYFENDELKELKADKQPIGKSDHRKPFTTHSLPLSLSALFLFTDGYADQFGGEKGKKFKYKPFQDILIQNSSQPMETQKNKLDTVIELWKGDLEQNDDICIIGVRI